MTENIYPFDKSKGEGPSKKGTEQTEGVEGEQNQNIRGPSSNPDDFNQNDEFWFLNPLYRPCPQFDVEIGDYIFRYRPEISQYFVRAGFFGKSLVAISSELALPFPIVKYWAGMIPTFAVSLEMSKQNAQFYWEERGRDGLGMKSFNFAGWLRMMSVCFPEHWSDLQSEVEDLTKIDSRSEKIFGINSPEEEQEAIQAADEIIERLLRLKFADGESV